LNTLGAVREPLEQIYRRNETTGRLSICRALHRLLARQPQIFDRLGNVIAAAVVMGQVAQMIVQLPGEHRLQGLTSVLVRELAPLDQQRVVGDLLRKSMLEDVFDFGQGRLLIDEFGELQIREYAVEFGIGDLHDAPDQPERELSSDYRQRLQQVFLIGGQPVDTRGKNRLHRRRNLQLI
jgi:hypothetical protein